MIVIIFALCLALCYCGYQYYKLKIANGALKEVREQGIAIEEQNEQLLQKNTELLETISSNEEKRENLRITNETLFAKNEVLLCNLEQNTKTLRQQNEEMAKITSSHEEQIEKEKLRYENNLSELAAQHQTQEQEVLNKHQIALRQLEVKWADEQARYLSAIQTIQNALTEDEDAAQRHVQVKIAAQEDITYLMNTVANRLKNPDVLYKLVWSEFIQKPTNEMLNYVLPQKDCAGIYKITNDRNKKAYIGRSTSVRKRLTDHIKSSVGISTIADQRIHQAMREEGIWNFTFELIEECDKERLNEREKFYIAAFQTEQLGYNQKAGG